MKRLFLALGMMLSVLIMGTYSGTAQAATACNQINASLSGWPWKTFTWGCTGTTTNEQSFFASTLQNFTQIPNFFPSAQFYLFKNEADYIDYGTNVAHWANMSTPGDDDFGVTDEDPTTGMPIRTAVFEFNKLGQQNSNGNGNGVPGNTNQVAFEAAKWLNPIYSNVSPGDHFQSATTDFSNEVAKDWTTFNGLAACGSGNIFHGKQDVNGNFICTGTGGVGTSLAIPYSGLAACAHPTTPATCNQAVLEAAWPRIFASNAGIFSESVANNSGSTNASPKDYDSYFQNAFSCVHSYNVALIEFDKPPVSTQLAAGCPVPPARVFCTRTFDGTTNFPGKGVGEQWNRKVP